MSIDFSQEEAQTTPLMTTSLLGEDEGEGSLRPSQSPVPMTSKKGGNTVITRGSNSVLQSIAPKMIP